MQTAYHPSAEKDVLFSSLYDHAGNKANGKKNSFFKICLVHRAQRSDATWCRRCGLLSLFGNHIHHRQWEPKCLLRCTHVYTQAELYVGLFSALPLEQLSQNQTQKMEDRWKWEVAAIFFLLLSFRLKTLIANFNCCRQNTFQTNINVQGIYFEKLTYEKLKWDLFSECYLA